MKKADVHIGHTYRAKVSGWLANVRITGESRYGGWDAVNTETKRAVRIKSPQRLRADLTAGKTEDGGPEMAKAKKGAQRAGAKKTARTKKAKTTSAKKRPSEKAMELAAKDRAKADAKRGACPKCGKPLEVIDADHKNGKVTYGCPACDGSKVETKRAEARRETTEKVDLLKRASEAREAKRQAKAAQAKEKAERLGVAPAEKKPRAKGQMSGLDAAARVLAEAGEPMNCQDIVKTAFEKGYWASDGATPHATIYAAMLREIQTKGAEARFTKAGPGLFALSEHDQEKKQTS